jgi:hypothetical protein
VRAVTKKQRAARAAEGLGPLFEKHLFWNGDDATKLYLLNQLQMHYRVFNCEFWDGGTEAKPWNNKLFDLLTILAGELYPAFKKLPSRGGRPRLHRSYGLLALWPYAHEARLVQLFGAVKDELKRAGLPCGISDAAKQLVRRYAGKYPKWRYNNLNTTASLVRRGWQKISSEIKANPERILPADGSEPTGSDGKPYLPPLPSSRLRKTTQTPR